MRKKLTGTYLYSLIYKCLIWLSCAGFLIATYPIQVAAYMPLTAGYRARGTHSHPFPHLLWGLILPWQWSPLVAYTTPCFSLWFTQFSYNVSPLNFPASAFEFLIFESCCSLSDGLWLPNSQKLPAAIPYCSLQKIWAASFKRTSPPEKWRAAGHCATCIAWCFPPLGLWKGKLLMIQCPFWSCNVLPEGGNLIDTILL